MVYNIYVETYGCSANLSNAEIIKGILANHGFNIVNNEKIADIVILNTCIVKGPTLKKIEMRILHFSKKNVKLIVAGCMPEVYLERIKKIAPRASVVSVHHVKEIARAVKDTLKGKIVFLVGKSNEAKLCLPRMPKNKIIGITQIAQGCINNCTYCIVKRVKGRLFSYPKEKIITDIKQNLKAGCKEIWLTSQDNACYGFDNGKQALPELLQEILKLKGNFFVRLGMMNPSSLLPIVDEIIECYKDKKMFKFLHLPVQSGSDKLLKLMNRNYTVKDFLFIINKFYNALPELTLSTDVIVGFPSETSKDFEKTIHLIKEVRPDIVNISKFWPMPHTIAAGMKPLAKEIVKKRAIELMKLHNSIALEKNKKLVGQSVPVLVDERGPEGSWLARTMNYKRVVLKGNLKKFLGKVIETRVIRATGHYLVAEIARNNKDIIKKRETEK